MGKRGPAPLPTSLKLLHGERRPQRLNAAEPTPRAGRPVRPQDLSPAATAVWRRVLRDQAPGVIQRVDREILRAYCEAVIRYGEAMQLYARSGPLIQRRGTFVPNPLHRIIRDNADLVRFLGRELGLTPAARSGLQGERGATDAFEEYLARGRRRPAG